MGFKPGPGPPNEPASFEFLTDNRLLHNPNITRMPTTQKEWNTFIQELNKWVKNETGTFDPTFGGFSSDPSSASCWWHRFGQMVQMEFVFTTGTSNATSFTITNLPEIITPRDDTTVSISGMQDNGTLITIPQAVAFKADGSIRFDSNAANGTWTNTGNKGFSDNDMSVIYILRQPGKH